MRSPLSKLLALLMAFALAATACGGGEDRAEEFVDIRDSDSVEPPERVDPKDIALPGLSLATNSPSWEELLRSPQDRGAVVLFVQPGGPSDRQGIARGDVITHVDGQRVWNDERALALLWSNKGETRTLTLKSRNDREREVEIKGEIPRQQPRPFLNVMIENNPNDATLRYLRAVSAPNCGKKVTPNCGTVQHNLADLKVALDKEPRFVEALTRQGAILFQQSLRQKEKDAATRFAGQALAAYTNALDIDPRHAQTLTLQAEAQLALGKAQVGKSDADRAVKIDGSLARANHALARAHLALKKPKEAAGPARAALASNPFNNLLYYRTLAEVFKELKRKDDCAKTLLAIVPWLENAGSELKKEAEQLEKESKENCG